MIKKIKKYNMKWISPLLRQRGTTGKFPIPALRGRGSIHLNAKVLKKVSENKLAVILIIAFTVIYLAFVLLSYWNLKFPLLDLGLYNRHLWGMANLDFGPNPLKEPRAFNLLGDHSHFILFLLLPFYAIFKSPIFLLVIQVLAISLSGIPIYLIALKYFKNKTLAAFWLGPYFLFFGFWSALVFPFHVAPLAVLPIAWGLFFLLEKKYFSLLISLGFLVLIKEDMPLVILMFALYLVVIQKQYRLGGIIALISLAYFYFLTNFWLPFFRKSAYPFTETSIGDSLGEILRTAFSAPKRFFLALVTPLVKVKTMIYMIFSFGGLPLLGLEILVLLLPIWLSRFLFALDYTWLTTQHHSATQGPILIVAGIIGAERLARLIYARFGDKKFTRQKIFLALTILVIICNLAVLHQLNYRYLRWFKEKSFYTLSQSQESAWRAVKMIPDNASVGAQTPFVMLSGRDKIYLVPRIDIKKHRPSYIILASYRGASIWPFANREKVKNYKDSLVKKHNYQVIFEENEVYLLRAN